MAWALLSPVRSTQASFTSLDLLESEDEMALRSSKTSLSCSIGWVSVAVLAACAYACGGSVDTGDTTDSGTPSGDSSTDTTTPPFDSFGPDTAPPPFDGPLDVTPTDSPLPDSPPPTDASIDTAPPDPSICDGLAAAICSSSTGTCCTSRGATYDSSSCTAAETAYCTSQISLVKSGKLTYDPTQLDACKAAWTSEVAKCSLFYIDWVKANAPCNQLFNGTVAPGGACTYDYQCQAAPGGSAYCNTTSKKCVSYVVVPAGAGCNYAGTSIHYCDDGYYCDQTSTTPTCKAQQPLGSSCDGPDDTSCGYLNVCDASGTCVAGAAAGTACTDSSTCSSWDCDPTTKKCTDPNVELGDPSSGLCSP